MCLCEPTPVRYTSTTTVSVTGFRKESFGPRTTRGTVPSHTGMGRVTEATSEGRTKTPFTPGPGGDLPVSSLGGLSQSTKNY